MKIPAVLLAILIAVGAASCGGDATPGQNANSGMPPSAQNTPAASGQPAQGPSAANRNDAEAPPKGAQFTIYCAVYRGPDHVLLAGAARDELIRTTGLHNWHIIHTEQNSSLYFGYYRTFDDRTGDPRETARAQADLHHISELKTASGEKLFKACIFLPLNDADPEAPAKWDLARLPVKARSADGHVTDPYWSLQIAAFQADPERKIAAVDAVRTLRGLGYEAYYFHGETISSVCIGAWPRNAIKEQETDVVKTTNADATLFYYNGVLPNDVNTDMVDKDGHKVALRAPKLEILSPSMRAAISTFPAHAVNGVLHEKPTKGGGYVKDPTFLVLIPHTDNVATGTQRPTAESSTVNSAANEAAGNILDNPTTPGFGKLRSLDNDK